MRIRRPLLVTGGHAPHRAFPVVPVAAARVLQEPLAALVFEHVDVAGYCPCCSDFDDFDLHVCDEMREDFYCAVCGYASDCAAPNVPAFHLFTNRQPLTAPIASFA